LATGQAFSLASNSTLGTGGGASTVFNVTRTGANASNNHSAYGISAGVSNTGTGSANYGGYFTAQNAASTNTAVTGNASGTSLANHGGSFSAIGGASGTNYGGLFSGSGTGTSLNYGLSAGASGAATQNMGGNFFSSGATSNSGISATSTGAATQNTAGYFAANGATTNYGVNSITNGAGTTNIAGQFYASGATANYAIIVPSGGGNVGIGNTSPGTSLVVDGGFSVTPAGSITAGATITIPANVSVVRILNDGAITANAASATAPVNGQRLTIYNNDPEAVTFAGASIAPTTGIAEFQYINAGWRTLSNSNGTTGIGVKWNAITDPDGALTLNHGTNASIFNFTNSTTTGWAINHNSLTSGTGLALASTSTGLTGTLASATLSGSNAANNGTVFKATNSGVLNTGTALMVTNLGAGNSFRVNDETGDADATPFIISSNGNVGVGSATPVTKMDVIGGARFGGRNYFNKTVAVSNTVWVQLTNQSGAALSTTSAYSVKLVTTGTGTDTGAEYLVWYDATLAAWQVRAVAISGTNSNHPALFIDAGVVKVRTYHATSYNVNVFVEEIEAGIADVTGHIFGTHYNWQRSGTDLFYNDGNVGIGVSPSTTYKLEVNGKLKTAGIDENSDARLKKDINPIYDALTKVTQMRGVTYNWRTEEFPERNFEKDMQFGLIAQELEKVIPELVTTDGDGYKAIEYSHLVPVLIEAIKELDAKNNEQKVQLDKQTKTNEELKASMENLLIRMNAVENNVENKTNKAEK
jgi:hypothetical protein